MMSYQDYLRGFIEFQTRKEEHMKEQVRKFLENSYISRNWTCDGQRVGQTSWRSYSSIFQAWTRIYIYCDNSFRYVAMVTIFNFL